MKIRIETAEKNLTIPVPDALLSPKLIPWIAEKIGRKKAPEALERIPPGALEVIFRELRRTKKRYGPMASISVLRSNRRKLSPFLVAALLIYNLFIYLA